MLLYSDIYVSQQSVNRSRFFLVQLAIATSIIIFLVIPALLIMMSRISLIMSVLFVFSHSHNFLMFLLYTCKYIKKSNSCVFNIKGSILLKNRKKREVIFMAGIITWNVKVSAWETILMHRIQQQCPSMMKFCKKKR